MALQQCFLREDKAGCSKKKAVEDKAKKSPTY
jgi:hypothetical protein